VVRALDMQPIFTLTGFFLRGKDRNTEQPGDHRRLGTEDWAQKIGRHKANFIRKHISAHESLASQKGK